MYLQQKTILQALLNTVSALWWVVMQLFLELNEIAKTNFWSVNLKSILKYLQSDKEVYSTVAQVQVSRCKISNLHFFK